MKLQLLETKSTTPEIPIIPLIDILAILLIFFIVSTTFKEARPALEIDLPRGEGLPTQRISESRTVLAIDAAKRISLGDQILSLDQLSLALQEWKRAHPTKKLELEADRTTPLELLLGVWEALTQAGIPIKEVPARIQLTRKEQ